MTEIEINMMSQKFLKRNIGSIDKITEEVGAWCVQSNVEKMEIKWSFAKQIADHMLSKYFVS